MILEVQRLVLSTSHKSLAGIWGFFHLEDFPNLSIKNQGRYLMLSNTAFGILLCSISDWDLSPNYLYPKNHINLQTTT